MIAVAAPVEPGVDVAAVVVVAAAVTVAAVEPEIEVEVATNFSPNFFSAYPHLKKNRGVFFSHQRKSAEIKELQDLTKDVLVSVLIISLFATRIYKCFRSK